MFILGSVLTNLILAVSLILAAAVAGLMAYHYAKARILERTGYTFDPETETVQTDEVGMESRAKSAEEIAQIRTRIEALMEQQQMASETQNQQVGQKLDEIRTHMGQQDAKMDGLKGELRHEIRRRDSELGELRQQLSTALDSFWKSMPALEEGNAPTDTRALPPAAESIEGEAEAAPEEKDAYQYLPVDAEEEAFEEAPEAMDMTSVPEVAPFVDSDPGFSAFAQLDADSSEPNLGEAAESTHPYETFVSDPSSEPEEATFTPLESIASDEPELPSFSFIEPAPVLASEAEPFMADSYEFEEATISPVTDKHAEDLMSPSFEPVDFAPESHEEDPVEESQKPAWEPLTIPTDEAAPIEELPSEMATFAPVAEEPADEIDVPAWEPLTLPTDEASQNEELPSEAAAFAPVAEEPADEIDVPAWEPLTLPTDEASQNEELPSEAAAFAPVDDEPAAEVEVPAWEPLTLPTDEVAPNATLPSENATFAPVDEQPAAEVEVPAWEPLTLPANESSANDELPSETETFEPVDEETAVEANVPAWQPLTLPTVEAMPSDELPSEVATSAPVDEEPATETEVPVYEAPTLSSEEATPVDELPSEMSIFTPVEFEPLDSSTEPIEENNTFAWKPLELPDEDTATEEEPADEATAFAPIEFVPLHAPNNVDAGSAEEAGGDETEVESAILAPVESGAGLFSGGDAVVDTMPPPEEASQSDESLPLVSDKALPQRDVFSGLFDQPQAPDAEPGAPEEVVWTDAAAWNESAAATTPVASAESQDLTETPTLDEADEDDSALSESSTPFVQHVIVSPSGDSISMLPEEEVTPASTVPAEASKSVLDAASLFTGSPSIDSSEEVEEPEPEAHMEPAQEAHMEPVPKAHMEPAPEANPQLEIEQTREDRPPVASAKPTSLHSAQGDDLTLISSITEDIQQKLYDLGITKLDEMARWSRADARRVSAQVNVSEEMIMHQWIFEAQSVLFDSFQDKMARQTNTHRPS